VLTGVYSGKFERTLKIPAYIYNKGNNPGFTRADKINSARSFRKNPHQHITWSKKQWRDTQSELEKLRLNDKLVDFNQSPRFEEQMVKHRRKTTQGLHYNRCVKSSMTRLRKLQPGLSVDFYVKKFKFKNDIFTFKKFQREKN